MGNYKLFCSPTGKINTTPNFFYAKIMEIAFSHVVLNLADDFVMQVNNTH